MLQDNWLPDFSSESITEWEEVLNAGFDPEQKRLIQKALDVACSKAHIKHAMPAGTDVAVILKKLGVDPETITAAILSDPRMPDALNNNAIKQDFNAKIAALVEDTHRLNTFSEYSREILEESDQIETLRRMLLAMVKDVRAVVIKLAYRIQRLRNIPAEDYEIRQYIARETLDIYAPLANRMGIAQLKWELEDLAFRYLQPQDYKKLANALVENRSDREDYLQVFTSQLSEHLARENIVAEVYGRPKHIYSIWRKMQNKQLAFSQLYDLRAVRVITEKVVSCYEVLGLVHSLWSFVPGEFDDYIAHPKGNGYQSLHTVVIGAQDAMVEIQIRTRDMHELAESGVAAHWRYKEGGKQDKAVEKSIASIRALLENRDEAEDRFSDFHAELYADRIFVLTPKGQLKDLSKGSTPLDFAYAIHTEVGHRCRGAKVNGKIVPLTYRLQSGEKVEILTAKQGTPNRSWIDPNMGYLNSPHAISKVKAWFKQQNHEQNLQDGKAVLEKERLRLGLEEIDIRQLADHFKLNREEDLLINLGRGDISLLQLAGALELPEEREQIRLKANSIKRDETVSGVTVQGVGNIVTHIGHCCKPVPGDSIIGYITQGKGITIHRKKCSTILKLPEERNDRLIDVSWGDEKAAFPVKVAIQAFDRQGLLSDVTQVLSHEHVNILELDTHTDQRDLSVNMILTIEVRDTAHLTKVFEKLTSLQNVAKVSRKNH